MSLALQVNDTVSRSYALEANELYDYPAKNSIQPLKTCPLTSELKEITGNYTTGNSFSFDAKFGQTQFLSNCIKYQLTIPLEITLTTPEASAITEANFMQKVFKNNESIVYSQYSILQCMASLGVELNNQNILNLTNVHDIFSNVSPYYSTEDVNEWFHSSTPDRYQDLSLYTAATGSQILSYKNENGETAYTSVAMDNEENIFLSKYARGFCTRTPQWTYVPGSGTVNGCKCTATVWLYLPLTFASVPDQMTALTGVERMQTNITLRNDVGRYLFNLKPETAGGYHIASIDLDTTSNLAKGVQLCQLYSPPTFMRQQLFDMNGHMQPYSLSIPRFSFHSAPKMLIAAGATASFDFSSTHTSVVPRAMYISMQRIKGGSFHSCVATPVGYGVLKSLTVRIDSATTTFNSTLALSYLADTNGYDEGDLLHRLLKGFPVKLDFGKDLSLPEELVVGQGKSFTITVSGNVLNQHSAAADYRLLIVLVNDATLDFSGNEFRISSGVSVSSTDLSNKNFLPGLYNNQMQRRVNVLGGGFFSGLGKGILNIGKKLWENREAIAKVIGDTVGLVKTIRGGELGSGYQYSNVSGGSGHTKTLGGKKINDTLFK